MFTWCRIRDSRSSHNGEWGRGLRQGSRDSRGSRSQSWDWSKGNKFSFLPFWFEKKNNYLFCLIVWHFGKTFFPLLWKWNVIDTAVLQADGRHQCSRKWWWKNINREKGRERERDLVRVRVWVRACVSVCVRVCINVRERQVEKEKQGGL